MNVFDLVWRFLAARGEVDELDSAQYRRVRGLWNDLGLTGGIAGFIRKQAEVPPGQVKLTVTPPTDG